MHYYKRRVDRYLWPVLISSLVVLPPSLLMAFKGSGDYNNNDYVPVNHNYQVLHVVPLNKPYHDDQFMKRWAYNVVRESFEFDSHNFMNVMAMVQPYYAANAFKTLMSGLKSSGAVHTVEEKHMESTVSLLTAPVILRKGLVGGRYLWQIQFYMQWKLVEPNTGKVLPNDYQVTVLAMRVPILESSNGVLIAHIVTKPVQENQIPGYGSGKQQEK